jgi:CBS domain-containing protein
MPVKNYCRLAPCTASPDESVEDAAVRMDARGIGSLVVVDANERPIGMLTDRDIVLSTVRGRLDAAATPVSEIMREPVVTVTAEAPIRVAIRFMRQYGVRRILVVDHRSGRLEGIVTADDVVHLLSNELSGAAELIRSQFPEDLGSELRTASSARGE